MRLLALDASTTAVGWVRAQDDQYLSSGVYTPRGYNVLKRIWDIENWLCGLNRADALDPELVILERPTGNHGNVGTSVKLGGVFYCLMHFYNGRGVEVLEVTASQVRASGCHKGALPVAESIKGAALDKRRPGDEADAIGVWLAGLKILKEARLKEGNHGG